MEDSPSLFPDTRRSLIVDAQGEADTRAQRALGEICQSYWYPLYVCLRANGLSPQDAEDRTQAFFANVLEHRSLDAVSPERGKLRASLKAALVTSTTTSGAATTLRNVAAVRCTFRSIRTGPKSGSPPSPIPIRSRALIATGRSRY